MGRDQGNATDALTRSVFILRAVRQLKPLDGIQLCHEEKWANFQNLWLKYFQFLAKSCEWDPSRQIFILQDLPGNSDENPNLRADVWEVLQNENLS